MGNAVGSLGSSVGFTDNRVTIQDIPEDNGMRFLGKAVPQEILCHILSFVPGKDLVLSVTRVCKCWNELLSDRHFWFTKLQVEGFVLPEAIRTRLMRDEDEDTMLRLLKILTSYQLPLNKNLIKNPSGRDELRYWKTEHGGDGIIVESSPVGSDPFPEEAGLPTQHCFVTSYSRCIRQQDVDLKSYGFTPIVMDILKPKIVISEWVSARWDCRSESKLHISLYGKDSKQNVKLEWSSDDENVVNRKWYELKEVITDYPEGLNLIRYSSYGKDRQFWAGHYGAKSAGSSVKIVL